MDAERAWEWKWALAEWMPSFPPKKEQAVAVEAHAPFQRGDARHSRPQR